MIDGAQDRRKGENDEKGEAGGDNKLYFHSIQTLYAGTVSYSVQQQNNQVSQHEI
jgi:hypothetical protein